MKDSKGRMSVCLNLFGNFKYIHKEWGNNNEASGWTSSYSVSSILVTMQAAMIGGNYLSKGITDVQLTKSIHSCNDCDHSNASPDKYWPKTSFDVKPQMNVGTNKIGNSSTFDPSDHIMCYATKICYSLDESENDSLFGYGVTIAKNGSLSSQCEHLTENAFQSGIRNSTTNQMFTHWLPLYISKEHWARVDKKFMECVNSIYAKTKHSKNAKPEEKVFRVLSSMMNNMVVQVMNQKNNLSANDKFINGYFNCYRLLVQVANEYPDLVTYSNKQIERFLKNTNNRSKKNGVPNLGDWLVLLAVSKHEWSNVASEFVEECDARNVFWYTQGTRFSPAKYPEFADITKNDKRNEKVFEATQISRNLVCFQTRFLNSLDTINTDEFDAMYGVVQDDLKNGLKGIYNDIAVIKNWSEYFVWNGLGEISYEDRQTQLIRAIKLSLEKGYHKKNNGNNNNRNNRNNHYNRNNRY
jgi:hypothetical protein